MSQQDRFNRAAIIDRNFQEALRLGNLPQPTVQIGLSDVGLAETEVVELFESQLASRLLDLRARELKNEGRCFYTIGSSGHEGNAVFGKVFRFTDMAFLHYRSQAFQIQRSKQVPGTSPIYDALLSLVASSDDPISGGRHKVLGSRTLFIPPQTSTIASHLPKAVGAALSISRARDLDIERNLKDDGVVVCSFGDASLNHATAQTALNSASWLSYQNIPAPIVFICEDNGIGISTRTPTGWVERNALQRSGVRYIPADGLNLFELYLRAKEAEAYVRHTRKPCFLHMKTVRLLAHAGSDPEWTYNNFEQIEKNEAQDPLLHTARILLQNEILTLGQIQDLYGTMKQQVRAASEEACLRPKLRTKDEVRASLTACRSQRQSPAVPSEEARKVIFGRDYEKLEETPLHLAKLLNYALADILLRYRNTLIFGEDVAQKGGVYNVTDGLYKKFGPKRIFNSPLDETSILGSAIGLAHNGFVPIPEIQFLAYLHNAEDQLRGEASTLAFFSQGQFTNPMVLRLPGLPYQKGFGGHFHNDNSLAVLRDIPGIIIAVPSQGAEAAQMLRACVRAAHEDGRVVVFVEPIALYMTKDLHSEGDKGWSFPYPSVDKELPVGQADYEGKKDILIVTYGNGVFFANQAKKLLSEKHSISLSILNLRWIAPLDWTTIIKAVSEHKKIIIFDECRQTGSVSEALVSGIVQKSEGKLPKIEVLAADDCFIPLGVAAAAGLPRTQEIVDAALRLGKGGWL